MIFRMIQKSGPIFLPFCHKSCVWQTNGRMDGRTDGQTKFSSLDRVCIPCSAVKIWNDIWLYRAILQHGCMQWFIHDKTRRVPPPFGSYGASLPSFFPFPPFFPSLYFPFLHFPDLSPSPPCRKATSITPARRCGERRARPPNDANVF